MAKIVNGYLSDNQLKVFTDIYNSTERFHTLVGGRQGGKSRIISRLGFAFAATEPNINVMFLAMDTTQCETLYDHILSIDNVKVSIQKTSKKPLYILLKNGSLISFRTVSGQPNRIRGKSIKYVFCDEFAFFPNGIFDRVLTHLTKAQKESKVIFASTPYGKSNDFYKFYLLGYDNSDTYLELGEDLKTKNKGYNSYRLIFSDNPVYDLEQIEYDRLRMPPEVFDEEVLGIFSEGGGEVFKNLKEVCILDSYRVPSKNEYLYAGIDWGMTSDRTVLTIMDKLGEVIYIKYWEGKRPNQIEELNNELLKFNKPLIYAESNGIGLPLIGQLRQTKTSVNELFMTQDLKATMVGDLIYDIQTKSVKLPSIKLCEELNTEMNRYTYSKTANGITYKHRQGENDDFIDSLLIANYVRRMFMNVSNKITSNYRPSITGDTGFYR